MVKDDNDTPMIGMAGRPNDQKSDPNNESSKESNFKMPSNNVLLTTSNRTGHNPIMIREESREEMSFDNDNLLSESPRP